MSVAGAQTPRPEADAEAPADVDRGAQDADAAAQPAQGAARGSDVHPKVAALVRLLARQAAREHCSAPAPDPHAEEKLDD